MNSFLNKFSILFSVILFLGNLLFSQKGFQPQTGIISGIVIDSASNNTIEYANVILFSAEDNKMVTGIATKDDGKFELTKIRPGKYYAEIQFMGYEKKRIRNISIEPNQLQYDLGRILLKPTAINIDAVYVEGERAPVSYQIDKKIVDVSQMQLSASGNAADVLQNVPSVTVDAEGTVSLRGSSDFTVLVDGRPSILDPQDVLQQIPATSIKTIEIVTNPSAKYNPEGTSGIINILLKKTENTGMTGVVNLNAGLNDKYGGDFTYEYKTSSYTLNFGANYNRRFSPGDIRREELYTIGGNTSTITSNGSNLWGREFWGLQSGIDLYLGEKDILGINGRFGSREMKRTSELNYFRQSLAGDLYFNNKGITTRGGDFYNLNTNYTHKFEKSGHDIKIFLTYGYRTGDENSITESIVDKNILEGKKNYENGPSKQLEGKIEYTLPLGEKSKFEAGYEGRTLTSQESTGLYEYDTLLSSYQFLPQYSHDIKTKEDQNSLYAMYSNEWGNLGFQGGIRGEYTYRLIELVGQHNSFTIDEWDYFPTIHASYKFPSGQQLMASYTRRIRRPGVWALEPFLTWMDANNVQKGNPSLKNQYIDSYEIGAQTSLGKMFLSAEAYYRITHDRIERIRSAYSENVTLTTFENAGNDYSLGCEFQISYDPIKQWNISVMGNVYDYRIKGTISGESFSRESFNWSMRFNNTFKFSPTTQMQLNTTFNSPTVSSQGKQESFYTTDFSIRQDLFNKAVSVNLQVMDLFQTSKFENTAQGFGYYSYNYFKREAPTVMLTIKYFINNYKQERKSKQFEERMEEEEY